MTKEQQQEELWKAAENAISEYKSMLNTPRHRMAFIDGFKAGATSEIAKKIHQQPIIDEIEKQISQTNNILEEVKKYPEMYQVYALIRYKSELKLFQQLLEKFKEQQ